ncbi:phosphate-binding protein [Salmonella enterica subsp. enterica serovar Enteritidis]|nr:phosphate-binding protein [Salmonella enterica subsp. enterica serovar Enteritidis]
MKNAKWLFLSIMMAFIGVPLLVNIITIIVGGMWAYISVLENSIPIAQSIEKATIIPVALLGAGLIFLCGRIWGKGNASEVNPEWRDCCLLMPALVVLMGWVILMFLTDLNIRAIGRKTHRPGGANALVSTQRNILFQRLGMGSVAHPGWLAALFCIGVWRCALGSATRRCGLLLS